MTTLLVTSLTSLFKNQFSIEALLVFFDVVQIEVLFRYLSSL